jgi:hypothetical protein
LAAGALRPRTKWCKSIWRRRKPHRRRPASLSAAEKPKQSHAAKTVAAHKPAHKAAAAHKTPAKSAKASSKPRGKGKKE